MGAVGRGLEQPFSTIPAKIINEPAVIVLTSAQLLALKTPVELIAAPGAGKSIQLLDGVIEYLPGTTGYTITAAEKISLIIDTGGTVSTVETASFIDGTTAAVHAIVPLKDVAVVANKALQVKNVGTNNFSAGNGTVKFVLNYRIIDL